VITNYLQQLILLFKRLVISYLIYFLCRLVFYFANHNYFQSVSLGDMLLACFHGLRFDSFSIVISNGLFIILSLLPLNWFTKQNFQKVLFWIYMVCNSVFIAFNCIDIAYFPFIKKRSDVDIFRQMAGQSDMGKLIPRFLIDFWWALGVYILLIFLMAWLYRRIKPVSTISYKFSLSKNWLMVLLLFSLSGGLAVLAVRGGLQRVPISIVNAGSVGGPDLVPLVLNTPFSLIKSVDEKPLEELHFYSEQQLRAIYDPIHHYSHLQPNKKNLVVILLESFSKEYTKLGRSRKSVTPFLDSLMDHSLVFTNAFSNGTKSIEGIPAILSAVPSFMENPFVNSRYANNNQSSLAYLLGKEGYQTAFLHGGINGTMNFDSWAKLAGYQEYLGKNEYNNDQDFDDFWGIWDEPYLQYSVKKLSTFREPFHTAIFTLSSHHPYLVPDKYKNKFPKTDLENSESIGYADYSLREFFMAAKKTKWYQNTVFVLTADHTSLSVSEFFSNHVGYLTIPILFFSPDNSLKGSREEVFSQMDILPSSLELLGYNKPFFSFGRSFSSPKDHFACFYQAGNYYQYGDSMVYIYTNQKLSRVYNYKRDSILKYNIVKKYPVLDSVNYSKYKAFFQTYNATLINNTGRVTK
jgi:arylsulfatase A-like enzyme